MNYSQYTINPNPTISSFSLSFIKDFTTDSDPKSNQWLNQHKTVLQSESLKCSIPSNTLFNISSLVFNHEKNKEKAECKYKCIYDPTRKAFCLVIDKHMPYASLTKAAILKLLDLSRELNVEAIILLINKENKDYVTIIKGMMIVGFAMEKKVNTTVIEDETYKIMKMSIKCKDVDVIEEVDF